MSRDWRGRLKHWLSLADVQYMCVCVCKTVNEVLNCLNTSLDLRPHVFFNFTHTHTQVAVTSYPYKPHTHRAGSIIRLYAGSI